MTYLQDKINTFFKKRHEIFKKPLEKIINSMLNKCKYINGESLERHNWGNDPIKLKHIPKNIHSPSFEEDLLNSLNLEDNEKSIVELLWGDIQLGKRVQACIIMWISVYILKRPVLYIFRNLRIDQRQLQDDITGRDHYNFNIQFIKNLFKEFNNELQEEFEETNIEYWNDYTLPELRDINSNDIISKLSNREAINPNDIFCCLMNHKQLAKINSKFSEYIYYSQELVNITVLVDESDLMCPTSSNDRTNDNDKKDSTECEILLAKIYKKVKYALHITGTAHSLLYNVTTRLTDQTDIQSKISKVHKMKRSNDYFGLFNDSINFNTTIIEPWWVYQDTENPQKKMRYDIVKDYNINIKKIIETILKRPSIKYNSLLISEEKIRANQFCLVDKIIKDFHNLFIVIYHGKCLRLYLSKKYEKEIKYWSQWDSKQLSSQRLWQPGGVYGSSIDTEKSEKLPNNYCYFDINTTILNIKLVYKLLRILFEKCDTQILCKTIITITGKYGERGYSFTSDDYDKYSLHLTDQYFVSHASLTCTDISQRLRLQGKYNDLDLKNGSMKLTLWTTPKLQDIIQNFYVKFIKEIEKFVMGCDNWPDIKDLLENIIDNGDLKFGKYMKYIDVSKKRKNLKPMKHYDKKNNGFKLIIIDEMDDTEISEWCEESKLPDYICINDIKEMNVDDFIDKYGISTIETQEYKLENELSIEFVNYCIKQAEQQFKLKLNPIKPEWFKDRKEKINNYYCESINGSKVPIKISQLKNNLIRFRHEDGLNDIQRDGNRRVNIAYDDDNNAYICISVRNKNHKCLPKETNDYKKKTPHIVIGDKVKYSIIKKEYKQQNTTHGYKNEDGDDFIEDDNTFPEKYYWKTPDGWLYLYDNDKPEIISLDIVAPLPVKNIIQSNISTETLINSDISQFAKSCCKKPDKSNLRFGLKDIFEIYKLWCKNNGKKYLNTQKMFKEEFEKINYTQEKSKGVDINKKPGKRGYNIMVSL